MPARRAWRRPLPTSPASSSVSEANSVFLSVPEAVLNELRQRGWRFYTIGGGARFMFAWDADPARVDELAADIRSAVAAAPAG